jgi:hypothetical protein
LIASMAVMVTGCLPVCYAGAASHANEVKSPDKAGGASTKPQR